MSICDIKHTCTCTCTCCMCTCTYLYCMHCMYRGHLYWGFWLNIQASAIAYSLFIQNVNGGGRSQFLTQNGQCKLFISKPIHWNNLHRTVALIQLHMYMYVYVPNSSLLWGGHLLLQAWLWWWSVCQYRCTLTSAYIQCFKTFYLGPPPWTLHS